MACVDTRAIFIGDPMDRSVRSASQKYVPTMLALEKRTKFDFLNYAKSSDSLSVMAGKSKLEMVRSLTPNLMPEIRSGDVAKAAGAFSSSSLLAPRVRAAPAERLSHLLQDWTLKRKSSVLPSSMFPTRRLSYFLSARPARLSVS